MCMSVDKWFSIPPVEKVKKSCGKIYNVHAPVCLLFLKTVVGGNVNAYICEGTCECECICLRASLRVNGVLFLGKAPGRCMSHTSHGRNHVRATLHCTYLQTCDPGMDLPNSTV